MIKQEWLNRKSSKNLVQKYLKQDSLIVNLGRGTHFLQGLNAVGIDLDEQRLREANLGHKILADYNYCPFRSESFDAVIMCHSLEHTNFPKQVLKEANRILKKTGIIGISVPNLRGLYAIWVLLWHGLLKGIGPDYPDHLTAFTPQLLKRILEESGFVLIDEGGNVASFPLMRKFKLINIGYWLAKYFPRLADSYIAIGRKVRNVKTREATINFNKLQKTASSIRKFKINHSM